MRAPKVVPSVPDTEATRFHEVVPSAGNVTVGNQNATVRPIGVLCANGVPVASRRVSNPTSESGAVPSNSNERLEMAAGPPIAVRLTSNSGALELESTAGATAR